MTIRRLLRRNTSHKIPPKYHAQLDQLVLQHLATLGRGLPSIEDLTHSGQKIEDTDKVLEDLDHKLSDPGVGAFVRDLVTKIVDPLRSRNTSWGARATALGALVYFITPLDLIPDAIPVLGYLDDFAVLSLALNYIASIKVGT